MGALKKPPGVKEKDRSVKKTAGTKKPGAAEKPAAKSRSTKLNTRPDHNGTHRGQFEKNRKRILATQDICGICGKPVDKSLKAPHPMSATIDHIIPVSKGGHPSDIDNLQLAHRCCNREKSDKIVQQKYSKEELKEEVISNRVLPLSMDWTRYEPG